jgi:hypothetical protein
MTALWAGEPRPYDIARIDRNGRIARNDRIDRIAHIAHVDRVGAGKPRHVIGDRRAMR